MFTPIQDLGYRTLVGIQGLGRVAHFGGLVARAPFSRPYRIARLVDELYNGGVLSLAIVCTSGAAVGAVLALQGYVTLSRFGAEESLGAVVGLSLVRELGPVLTALLVIGRAGSAIAAEIGAMVATEQLDGLRMMSIDPIHFVASPKAMGIIASMPLLAALFVCFGLGGGYLVGVQLLGIDPGSYISSLQANIDFADDVLAMLLKAFVFGLLVATIATYRGYTAAPNSEGVSRATTSCVVEASVATLIIDYVITALWGV